MFVSLHAVQKILPPRNGCIQLHQILKQDRIHQCLFMVMRIGLSANWYATTKLLQCTGWQQGPSDNRSQMVRIQIGSIFSTPVLLFELVIRHCCSLECSQRCGGWQQFIFTKSGLGEIMAVLFALMPKNSTNFQNANSI